jgi:hypothetical protein
MKPIILFKLTTKNRLEKAVQVIQNICEMVNDKINMKILVSLDYDDKNLISTRNEINLILANENVNGCVIVGNSNNKIDAINRDVREVFRTWDIIVNVSDDNLFICKGFDDIIRDDFSYNFDMILHYPDGNRNDLLTMSIIGREYYNRFNYIYNPNYKSLFCDNEAMEVGKILNLYKFCDKNIFVHNHPAYGKSIMDEQYILTESFYSEDEVTYKNRKYNNFDLDLMGLK